MKTRRAATLKRLRCDVDLEHGGHKLFREGINWGWLGFLGELFEKSEAFDVYYCPTCGKVEFFLDKVGEENRPQ